MFLKTAELKKNMKNSLKKFGLIVGTIDDHYLVYTDCWGLYIETAYASNKLKAAITEVIGDIPQAGECYLYKLEPDKLISQESVFDYPDPYEDWKAAKDFAAVVPFFLFAWPQEYLVCQKHSDLDFIILRRSLTQAVISSSELDTTVEAMPVRPSVLGSALYWKNETTIYWACAETPGSKVREVLFPHLEGISFFEDDWMVKDGLDAVEPDEANSDDDQLPY